MIKHTRMNSRRQSGYSLIEVVIGIFIFAVGMTALAFLQGSLTRGQADANARSVATNIGEQLIERTRGFAQLDTSNTVPAYEDIRESAFASDLSITRGGVVYTVGVNLLDYRWDGDSFECFTGNLDNGSDGRCTSGTLPLGVHSDFKVMEVTVTWAAPEFRVSEGTETTGRLGSGSVTVTGLISSIPTPVNAQVVSQSGSSLWNPDVNYTPGQRPDVIALSLGENRFKESSTPEPDVIRTGELVETTFDVITYNQVGVDSSFLRREEFTVVSCECTLAAADADNPARRPVVWAGDEYKGGGWVAKQYGTQANNQQSEVCEVCCRDHHDGGTGTEDHGTDAAYNRYGPVKATSEHTGGSFSNNHKHYKEDGVTVAGVGDTYLEACRTVRVDGFPRVAQDMRQEDRYMFPADFLDGSSEVDLYSTYVTTAATAYESAATNGYSTGTPPCIGVTDDDSCAAAPTMQGTYPTVRADDEFPSWSTLPFGAGSAETQQLRSRGVYIDYLSNDLRAVIDCLSVDGGTTDTCKSGEVEIDKFTTNNTLVLIPFYDVQKTFLNRWNESPTNTPVDTTNETLATGNTHSRGMASRNGPTGLSSTAQAKGHRGNLGFTDTLAIDPLFDSMVKEGTLTVHSLNEGDGGTTPGEDPEGVNVSGVLTESVPGNPTITITGLGDALCDATPNGYECLVEDGASAAQLKIEDYGKNRNDRVACATGLSIVSQSSDGVSAFTIFQLVGVVEGTAYNIQISAGTACGS